jgi:signal transduction histidine kinase
MSETLRFENDLGRSYARSLARYLLTGGEAPLEDAYELGRKKLTSGGGVLDMVNLHHAAIASVLDDDSSPILPAETMRKAGEFLAESMSPFEMTHRAIGEANSVLRRLNETLEEEVQRIALALHDDAGQLMVAVHLSLDEAVRDMPPEMQARMSGVRALLGLVEDRIRDLSHELHPAMLDQLGLVPAVEFLAANVGQRTGLRITVDSKLDVRLPPAMAIAFYRIVQEALNNVRRHAQATRVRIRIGKSGSQLRCTVSDDGVGFDPASTVAANFTGLGLRGIRERLHALGGKLRIQSAGGRGVRLEATAPLQVIHADSTSARRRSSRGSRRTARRS